MKLQRKHLVVSAGLVVLLVAGLIRLSIKKARAGQDDDPPRRPVAVALVERKPLVNSVALSGEFRPFQEVDVHAKVAGYIRQIYVDVGDRIKTGQVLAVLEVPELNAQVLGAGMRSGARRAIWSGPSPLMPHPMRPIRD